MLAACQQPAEITPQEEEPWQGPGTRRMAQRLALLAKQARQQPNAYMNREQAALLERLAVPEDPGHRFDSELKLAGELLRAGRTATAASRSRPGKPA